MKNLILILTLLSFFACNDTMNEDIAIQDPESGRTPAPTLADYYAAGYDIGTGDADWLVDQTWTKVKCVEPKFKSTNYTIDTNENGVLVVSQGAELDKNQFLTSCLITTVTQELAFDEFISIYPYKVGYTQHLQSKINSSSGTSRAFHQGILAGFKNRLCGWSITMPFNFTNCSAIDLPPSGGGSGTGSGGSGLGDPPCVNCGTEW